jgi:hypothetical protein
MVDSLRTPPSFYDRLCVDVKGPPAVRIEDIISIRFSENLAQRNSLEVLVNNWDAGSQSYKYSEGNLLRIGAGISLYSKDTVLADGTIAAVAPSFREGSASTLMFTADAKHPPGSSHRRKLRAALAVGFGRELLEFYPVLRKAANLSRPRIEATGVAVGLPMLIAGAKLKISGVGAIWSGEYSVTETTHTFNPGQFGYRTGFACSKG